LGFYFHRNRANATANVLGALIELSPVIRPSEHNQSAGLMLADTLHGTAPALDARTTRAPSFLAHDAVRRQAYGPGAHANGWCLKNRSCS
jgi:hypothetical protein